MNDNNDGNREQGSYLKDDLEEDFQAEDDHDDCEERREEAGVQENTMKRRETLGFPGLVRKSSLKIASSAPPIRTTPAQPVMTEVSASDKDNRIKITAKVDPSLHSRLRIHSFKTHVSVTELIESWIKQNCPEV